MPVTLGHAWPLSGLLNQMKMVIWLGSNSFHLNLCRQSEISYPGNCSMINQLGIILHSIQSISTVYRWCTYTAKKQWKLPEFRAVPLLKLQGHPGRHPPSCGLLGGFDRDQGRGFPVMRASRWVQVSDLWSIRFTLWLFNIAMENGLFIDGLPIRNGDFPWQTVK